MGCYACLDTNLDLFGGVCVTGDFYCEVLFVTCMCPEGVETRPYHREPIPVETLFHVLVGACAAAQCAVEADMDGNLLLPVGLA
jgi:hypothetical protein